MWHGRDDHPFSALQRSFELVVTGSGQPRLPTTDVAGIEAEELSAAGVVTVLRCAPVELADVVWRRVIARSRAGQAVWTVIAAGALLPRLVRVCARFGRVPSDHIADVEAEMLAALLEEIGSLDTSVADVGSRLCGVAGNAAYRYGYHTQRDGRRLVGWNLDGVGPEHAVGGRGPVSVLAEAITTGVLSEMEAELIARTRLEGQRLGPAAAELGLAYITARRRRQAAEARLAAALGAEKFLSRVSANAA